MAKRKKPTGQAKTTDQTTGGRLPRSVPAVVSYTDRTFSVVDLPLRWLPGNQAVILFEGLDLDRVQTIVTNDQHRLLLYDREQQRAKEQVHA